MMSIPMTIATTSVVASAMLGGPMATTSAVDQSQYLDRPEAYIRYLNDQYQDESATLSARTASYESVPMTVDRVKNSAYDMFGEMRNSTPEENRLYDEMLARKSTPIGVDIYSL